MHIAIIGNGISGITAARFLRKLTDHKISVISSETQYFYSRTALMYIYMGHMKYEHTKPYEDWFWSKNSIELIKGHITGINFEDRILHFDFDSLEEERMDILTKGLRYDKLVIAVGSTPNRIGWPGQDLEGVGSLYSIQDLNLLEDYSNNIDQAVIVGGGLIGIELAEMLLSRKKKVTFLVRENTYWNNVLPLEESEMISRHIREHHIDLRLATELKEIVDDGNGRCKGVITDKGEFIPAQYVGLTAGVRPNIDFLKNSGLEIGKGILVNQYLKTSVDDVYAIGDCAEVKEPLRDRRAIEAVWYCGKMMGETLAYRLAGYDVSYDPGIWFNSAKFLDIEYQVYGTIKSKRDEETNTLFWIHPDGKKSIRIDYRKKAKNVIGFNLMGIRFRHDICNQWISQKKNVQDVLTHLAAANFDPEFCKSYEQALIDQYNQQNGDSIQLRSMRGLQSMNKLMKI